MQHLLKIRSSLLVLGLGLATPAFAADQLVAFDIVYTATEAGNIPGEKWHYLVKPSPSEPASWTTPVDYSKGTIYIHQEVMTKPSARPTQITICFDGDKAGYGCTATKTYTTTGVHETVAAMTSTWQYGQIAWNRRRSEYHLVLKDPALGGTPGGRPPSDFVPSMMRIVMTIVPPGGTYVPPPPMGGAGGISDAGAAPMADAGATAGPDAAVVVSPDAGKSEPTPTPAPDAGAAKPTPRPDASVPPKDDPEDPPAGNQPAAKSGGCAMGGGSVAGAALPFLVVGLLAAIQRRRRRNP